MSFRFGVHPSVMMVVLALAVGCTKPNQETASNIQLQDPKALRPLSESDALADYDTMVAAIRSTYGPLEYKQRRFGYDFETEAAKVRAKFSTAATDAEKQALFYELLRKLEDGHISLIQPIRERYEIPVIVIPVEGKYIVWKVAPALAPNGITPGDEILAVDGMSIPDALKIVKKYAWFANAESDLHLGHLVFYRPSHIPELVPKNSFAQIEFAKPDGTKRLARIAWRKTSPQQRLENGAKTQEGQESDEDEDANFSLLRPSKRPASFESRLSGAKSMVSERLEEQLKTMASVADMGADAPWYWNPRLKRKYGLTMVTPERERVQNFYALWVRELNLFEEKIPTVEDLPEELPEVWAGLYRYNGKTVLIMRQPSYSVDDIPLQLAIYSALIDQYQPVADSLVIDQTHNPGGAVVYQEGFAQLFAPQGLNGFVQFLNTDRLWYMRLNSAWTAMDGRRAASATGARVSSTVKNLERDSEAGLRLTQEPFSFSLREVLPPAPAGVVWRKPMLVLIDELCGSGGDSFPMLVKANKLGRLFGNRTMGLGGSVEKTLSLPFTRASLSLTRGLFTTFKPDGKYTDTDFVENNGVQPDVLYKHTIKDVREGFDAYFNAFSIEATK